MVSGRPRCGALAGAGRARRAVGAGGRGSCVPPCRWWSEVEALVAARAAEPVQLVVTHSDLVPGNVVMSVQGRAWIVDWDDAGPWNTAEEVAAAVVSWSSGVPGEPNERVARALIEGYRGAGGGLEGGSPTVLAGSLSAVAKWLELNVRRSLDETADRRFRWRAEAAVAGALADLAAAGPAGPVDGTAQLTARTSRSHGDRASRLPLQPGSWRDGRAGEHRGRTAREAVGIQSVHQRPAPVGGPDGAAANGQFPQRGQSGHG